MTDSRLPFGSTSFAGKTLLKMNIKLSTAAAKELATDCPMLKLEEGCGKNQNLTRIEAIINNADELLVFSYIRKAKLKTKLDEVISETKYSDMEIMGLIEERFGIGEPLAEDIS